MTRRWRTGVTAAAVLPSALAAGLLVSAPFAGTTTAPLADSHARAAVRHVPAASHRTAAFAPTLFEVPTASVVTLVGAEALLVSVGAGVIVVARKRSRLDQA